MLVGAQVVKRFGDNTSVEQTDGRAEMVNQHHCVTMLTCEKDYRRN